MVIAGRIILTRNEAPAETKSGIVLPESMTTELNIGTVKYVGADTKDMKAEVVPGDVIVFNHKTVRKQEFNLYGQDVVEIGFEDVYLIHKNQ